MVKLNMKERDMKIDLLKTVAIVLMSFVHVNSLLYSGKGLLDSITYLGATVCFSIFLFGIAYIQGKKLEDGKEINWRGVLRNSLQVYIPYLILGFISTLIFKPDFVFLDLLKMAIFAYLPNYVEFLIAFILFYLFAKLAYKPLKKYIDNPYVLIMFAIITFTASLLLSKIEISNPILLWLQTHLVGSRTTGVHSFPLLAYMPIYVSGLLLSKYGNKLTYSWTFSLSFLALVLLEAFSAREWFRWPPSLTFILYGILFISLLMFLFEFVKKSKVVEKITLLGKNPMESWVYLTLFAFLLRMILVGNVAPLLVWLLNIAVLILAYVSILLSKKSQ